MVPEQLHEFYYVTDTLHKPLTFIRLIDYCMRNEQKVLVFCNSIDMTHRYHVASASDVACICFLRSSMPTSRKRVFLESILHGFLLLNASRPWDHSRKAPFAFLLAQTRLLEVLTFPALMWWLIMTCRSIPSRTSTDPVEQPVQVCFKTLLRCSARGWSVFSGKAWAREIFPCNHSKNPRKPSNKIGRGYRWRRFWSTLHRFCFRITKDDEKKLTLECVCCMKHHTFQSLDTAIQHL